MNENTSSDQQFLVGFSIIIIFLSILTLALIGIARAIVPPNNLKAELANSPEKIAARLQSVSQVMLDGESAVGSASTSSKSTDVVLAVYLNGSKDPDALYKSACAVCHSGKLPNIPQLGDKAMWKPRIAKGKDQLLKNAISGINAMPARGGTTMSDEQLKAVVQYMISKSQ
ncbi:MAG: c-type cytochrome [Methylacidiphilales bacterium]|nr:c-type cytochrome [Candidatus Methylacidiphilales bacterium]